MLLQRNVDRTASGPPVWCYCVPYMFGGVYSFVKHLPVGNRVMTERQHEEGLCAISSWVRSIEGLPSRWDTLQGIASLSLSGWQLWGTKDLSQLISRCSFLWQRWRLFVAGLARPIQQRRNGVLILSAPTEMWSQNLVVLILSSFMFILTSFRSTWNSLRSSLTRNWQMIVNSSNTIPAKKGDGTFSHLALGNAVVQERVCMVHEHALGT